MTLSLHDPRTSVRYAEGWATSLFVHGLVVAGAVLLFSDLKLAPQPEPFKWDVAMVQEAVPQPIETPSTPPPKPETPPPVRQPEIKPIVKPQPVQRVVQQEVREIRPIIQSRQEVTRERVPVMNETVAIPKSEPIVQEARVAEPTPQVQEAPPTPAPQPEPAPVVQEQVATRQEEIAQQESVVTHQEAVAQETVVARAAPVQQEAPLKNLPVQTRPTTRPDYGWLAEALWNRVERLKRYPHMARMNRWEGKVVLQAIVRDDGQLSELKVAQTSGYAVLDQDALEVLRRASPLMLKHPLGQPQVVIQVPISYRLEH